jgi:hypothetical protein
VRRETSASISWFVANDLVLRFEAGDGVAR